VSPENLPAVLQRVGGEVFSNGYFAPQSAATNVNKPAIASVADNFFHVLIFQFVHAKNLRERF